MQFSIREMSIQDYEGVFEIWQSTPGIGLSEADSRGSIQRFLSRNPGLSFVAQSEDELVGAVLCGHDGRRGYIHHLVVSPPFRLQNIGTKLVSRCMSALAQMGIQKCHLFVFRDNQEGITFWERLEWVPRDELQMMSHFV
jgi:ribosomal protein S18 acetylase RimI-like enzyme